MFEVMVESEFSAARQLLNYDGPCAAIHGHNFRVQVYACTDQLDDANITLDFAILKRRLNELTQPMDHRHLNDLPAFQGESPSSEFIARYLYNALKAEFPEINRVTVFDTPQESVTYRENSP